MASAPDFSDKKASAADAAALVRACRQGSRAAWDEMVNRYGRLVYSIPRRYGLGDADADDVFQAVFTILYRKLDQLRDVERLSAWLIRITHRECHRVARRRPAGVVEGEIPDAEEPAPGQAVRWERQFLVREGLRRLGGRCEQLLTALFLASGSPNYQAIADELGMKVGSIGPTRARCFEKLEKILLDLGLRAELSDVPCE